MGRLFLCCCDVPSLLYSLPACTLLPHRLPICFACPLLTACRAVGWMRTQQWTVCSNESVICFFPHFCTLQGLQLDADAAMEHVLRRPDLDPTRVCWDGL